MRTAFLAALIWVLAMAPSVGAKSADFNRDGVVDFEDFFQFGEAFGGDLTRFDLSGDGSIDFADFFLFADDFGARAEGDLWVRTAPSREQELVVQIDHGVDLEFVWIPPGSYTMGSPDHHGGCSHDRAIRR